MAMSSEAGNSQNLGFLKKLENRGYMKTNISRMISGALWQISDCFLLLCNGLAECLRALALEIRCA
jgi:hypothetical protein